MEQFFVWSNEHRAWWRPNSAGYTVHVSAAGRYTHDEAVSICAGSRDGWKDDGPPSEIPVRIQDVMVVQAAAR